MEDASWDAECQYGSERVVEFGECRVADVDLKLGARARSCPRATSESSPKQMLGQQGRSRL